MCYITGKEERRKRLWVELELLQQVLPPSHEDLPRTYSSIFLCSTGKDERRKRLRVELMRWHPDKFEARFGRRLALAERQRILDRVKAQSQALNALATD